MRQKPTTNPWVMALVSWAIATAVVSGGYIAFMLLRGEPVQWSLVRDAALMVVPIALFLGWRDRMRRK